MTLKKTRCSCRYPGCDKKFQYTNLRGRHESIVHGKVWNGQVDYPDQPIATLHLPNSFPEPVGPADTAASDSGPDNYQDDAFFAIAEPCESCGEPCENRTWNVEHELWIGLQCSCNAPDTPTCPDLIPQIEECLYVDEVSRVIRAHRATCPVCGPKPIPRKPVCFESARVPSAEEAA